MNEAPAKHEVLILPERLDYANSLRMMSDLRDFLNEPIQIDASQVAHLGAYAAQILLSAQKQWSMDEADFVINASPAFQKCWDTLGFPRNLVEAADPS